MRNTSLACIFTLTLSPLTAMFLVGPDALAEHYRGLPLHSASFVNNIEQVKLLLADGACVDAKDHFNTTPLHIASNYGYAQLVELLLQAGARIESANKDGQTPLFKAVLGNHIETVKVLLKAGANAQAKNKRGQTPLYWVPSCRVELATWLIAYGATLDASSENYAWYCNLRNEVFEKDGTLKPKYRLTQPQQ